MKKVLVISLIAIFVLSMGAMAFADAANTTPEWFNDMIKWRKDQVKEAVKDEVITKDEAKYWNDRIEYMEKFHRENGFEAGGCFGQGGRGFGPGMMGGYWNNNVDSVK